jgi:hypothetical protein
MERLFPHDISFQIICKYWTEADRHKQGWLPSVQLPGAKNTWELLSTVVELIERLDE